MLAKVHKWRDAKERLWSCVGNTVSDCNSIFILDKRNMLLQEYAPGFIFKGYSAIIIEIRQITLSLCVNRLTLIKVRCYKYGVFLLIYIWYILSGNGCFGNDSTGMLRSLKMILLFALRNGFIGLGKNEIAFYRWMQAGNQVSLMRAVTCADYRTACIPSDAVGHRPFSAYVIGKAG